MKRFLFFVLLVFASQGLVAQSQDSYKAALKKMLETSGSEGIFKSAITQIVGMYKQQYTQMPESVFVELENELMKTSLDDLVELIPPVYQKHLTQQDILQIIEFYNTPIGKKFAATTPAITQESMQVGQQWGMQIGQGLQEKLKEKGY